jgi:hypothetical protein
VKAAIAAAFIEVAAKDYPIEFARSCPKVFCTLLGKLVPAHVRAEPSVWISSPWATQGSIRRARVAVSSSTSWEH